MKKFTFLVTVMAFGFASIMLGQSVKHQRPFSTKHRNGQTELNLASLKNAKATFLPASALHETYNGSAWVFYANTFYSYNAEGLVSEEIRKNELNVNLTRITYVYNVDKLPTVITTYNWSGSAWAEESKVEMAYDEFGIATTTIYYEYDSGWQILTGTRTTYYNTPTQSGHFTEIYMAPSWVGVSGSRDDYVYDSNSRLISQEYYQFEFPDGWIRVSKSDYTYDGAGKLTTMIDETFVGLDGEPPSRQRNVLDYGGGQTPIGGSVDEWDGDSWEPFARYTNITWLNWTNSPLNIEIESYIYQLYTGGVYVNEERLQTNTITDGYEQLYSYWTGSAWVVGWRDTFQQNDNLYRWKEEEWNGAAWQNIYLEEWILTPTKETYETGSWESGIRVDGYYNSVENDAHGNVTEELILNWDADQVKWVPEMNKKYTLTYEGETSKLLTRVVEELDVEAVTPVFVLTERFTYSYSSSFVPGNSIKEMYMGTRNGVVRLMMPGSGVIEVIDLGGRQIKTLYTAGGETTVHLPAVKGVYLLRVNINGKLQTLKVIHK
jgi:hypothetical protein